MNTDALAVVQERHNALLKPFTTTVPRFAIKEGTEDIVAQECDEFELCPSTLQPLLL